MRAWRARNKEQIRRKYDKELARKRRQKWMALHGGKAGMAAYMRAWNRKKAVEGITDPVWREIRLALFDFVSWENRRRAHERTR